MLDLATEISLDRDSEHTITRQLIEGIRGLVHSGRLEEHERLPSTRELATGLGISRNIVSVAYDQLAAEGYLTARTGAGTFVAAGAFPGRTAGSSKMGRGPGLQIRRRLIRFNAGNPDLKAFPVAAWAASLKKAALRARERDLGYSSVQGTEELREELAGYLLRSRGIACSKEEIVIVSGITQAAALLASPGNGEARGVIIEDPALEYVQAAFTRNGCRPLPVPADEAGLQTAGLPQDPQACLVYVVPSHQYPLGGILPIQRRISLVNYARAKGLWILEDDYDSEFRYEGASVEPLQLLAPERVAYFGTFSKSMYPAIRLGYLVLPEELLAGVLEVKKELNLFSSSLEQLALAEWIRERRFEAHIYRMKKLYRRRRERVIARLNEAFGPMARVLGENAGLHVLVEFPGRDLDESIIDKCRKAGIELDWVEESALIKGRHKNRIVMGYGGLTDKEIDDGVRRLREVLD